MVSKRIELVDEEEVIYLPTPEPEAIILDDSFTLSSEYLRVYTDVIVFVTYYTNPDPPPSVANITMWDWNGNVTKRIILRTSSYSPYRLILDRRGGFYTSIYPSAGTSYVYRFNGAGEIDTTWGIGGYIETSWRDMMIDSDDNIYAVGTDYYLQKRDKTGALIWGSPTGSTFVRCIEITDNYIYTGWYMGAAGGVVYKHDKNDGTILDYLMGMSSQTACLWMRVDEDNDRVYFFTYRTLGSTGYFRIGRLSDNTVVTSLLLGATQVGDCVYIDGYYYFVLTTIPKTIQGFSGCVFKASCVDDVITIVAAYTPTDGSSNDGICIDQHKRLWIGEYKKLKCLDLDLNVLFVADDCGGYLYNSAVFASIPNTRDFDVGFLPF